MPDSPRRHQILAAAERLLCRYGPAKTTMAEVAREAGVGVGSVYLEFESKDEIVEELSASSHSKVLAAMRSVALRSTGSYEERLRAALETRVEAFLRFADEGTHACDLFHCSSAAVKSSQARYRDEEHAFFAELIDAGIRSGEFETQDAGEAARTLLRAYMSFSPPFLYGASKADALRALKAMHRLVLAGLLARGAQARRRSR